MRLHSDIQVMYMNCVILQLNEHNTNPQTSNPIGGSEMAPGHSKTIGKYSYIITLADLEREQQALSQPKEYIYTKIVNMYIYTIIMTS